MISDFKMSLNQNTKNSSVQRTISVLSQFRYFFLPEPTTNSLSIQFSMGGRAEIALEKDILLQARTSMSGQLPKLISC